MFIRKMLSACVGTALIMSLAAGGGALAAEASAGVEVKEFQFLDMEFDRISLDSAAEPDGQRDGHLRLLLDAGDGTEIRKITMKTADSQGNEVYHGLWKTWRQDKVDSSYLIVVVQDGKTINSTFADTLGTFKGMTELELYASDNNGMKEGEYYYLEIETNKGLVKTPITPFAENVKSYAPVVVREFSWKDLTSDETGIAKFGPDGNLDAHFKLKLHFAQKTEVLSVILRGTDKDGVQGPGIWRTNRAGIGWLLGIAQGKKAVTPGFYDDVTTPVGSFRGIVDLDLYAGNNGSIKNGEYYVVEVETKFGTVITKPIKFGDPDSNYINNDPLGFKTITLMLNSKKASVDEKNYTLEAAPFKLEGRTMVPIRFIGEALGAKVQWDSKDRRVTLTKEGTKIELVIDQKEAYVNGVAAQLDSPAVIRNNITLLPVRFVSENMKMKVFFDDGEIVITDAVEQK